MFQPRKRQSRIGLDSFTALKCKKSPPANGRKPSADSSPNGVGSLVCCQQDVRDSKLMERCMSQIDDEKEHGQLNGVVVVVVVVVVAAFIPDDAGARSMLATNYTSVFVTAQASAKSHDENTLDARGRHSPVYKLVQGGRDSAGPQPGHGMEPAQGRWFRRHPCQVCQAWAR
ncbi:hypothetical protein MY4824_001066 [Beauveria thailandica]